MWCAGGLVTKLGLTLGTPWTVAHQAPLSMVFPRQEYWSGLTFPSPKDLPDPGIEHASSAFQADSLPRSYHGVPNQLYNNNTINRRESEREIQKEKRRGKEAFSICLFGFLNLFIFYMTIFKAVD